MGTITGVYSYTVAPIIVVFDAAPQECAVDEPISTSIQLCQKDIKLDSSFALHRVLDREVKGSGLACDICIPGAVHVDIMTMIELFTP